MTDLYAGISINAVSALVAFLACWYFARKWKRPVLLLMLLGGFALLAVYLKFWFDKLWITRLLPYSNVIIVGNFTPVIAAGLAGVASRAMDGLAWRKFVALGPLVGLACWMAWRPVWSIPPKDPARFVRGMWRQNDQASCTPSSAATFLNLHGIKATAPEMATLCLTTKDGTSNLGMYRGLVLKTQGTGWRVKELVPGTFDALRAASEKRPVLMNVGLPYELPDDLDPRYARDWGWRPGTRHTATAIQPLPNGYLFVADPAVGRERWSPDALRVLWHGEAVRLEKAGE
jgi:hypothetical protein